jgi:hypothetical protein
VEQYIIILKSEGVAEETEKYILEIRKRYRRDILPIEGIVHAEEIQSTSRSTKRDRR